MTEEPRFTRAPRTPDSPDCAEVVRAKFRDSLAGIEAFLAYATSGGRGAFTQHSPAYATGSMAIIRAAALFENAEFDGFLTDTSEQVRNAIRTMRHIASHAGYRAMNDDVLWTTLTVDLPPHLSRWRKAVDGGA